MNLEKFFFNCPKFLQNGFFSPGWRLVLPAARPWFWPRPGSQVFRADSGRRHRFRYRPGSQVFRSDSGRPISVLAQGREPGFQGRFRSPIPARKRPHFFTSKPLRQKRQKTATLSIGKLARYIYIPLPICQFMDMAVFLPITLHLSAF